MDVVELFGLKGIQHTPISIKNARVSQVTPPGCGFTPETEIQDRWVDAGFRTAFLLLGDEHIEA